MTNYDKQRQTYRTRFMNYLQIIVFKFLDSKYLCRHDERKQNNFTYVLRIIGDLLISILQ